MSGILLDEHMPKWWPAAIRQLQPHLEIWRINDGAAPPVNSPDSQILEWCESCDAILLTNNRSSMPGHLIDHIGSGRHVPGIFIVDPGLDIVVLATTLSYILGAMLPNEFEDQITYPPLIVV